MTTVQPQSSLSVTETTVYLGYDYFIERHPYFSPSILTLEYPPQDALTTICLKNDYYVEHLIL